MQPQELGILVYGRNLAEKDGSMTLLFKQALKHVRTQLTEMKILRGRDSVTEEEIEKLEDEFRGLDLPEDDENNWIYLGYCYQNQYSMEAKKCYVHPNREFLIKRYLDDINAEFKAYNDRVQQEWDDDVRQYDTTVE